MRHAIPVSLFTLAAAASAHAEIFTVYVFNYDFSINTPGGEIVDVTINLGDTVRWNFLDSGHSTTSVGGNPEYWNSGYVGVVGTTFDHTFTNTGVFWYYCYPHGFDVGDGTALGMAGTVTVVPTPASPMVLAGVALLARRRRRA